MLALYRRALAVRRATPDLTSAGFELLLPDDPDLVVYRRGDVVVVLNMSDHERRLPADLVGWLSSARVVGRACRTSADSDSAPAGRGGVARTLIQCEPEAGLEIEQVQLRRVDGEAGAITDLRRRVRLDAGDDDPIRRRGGVLGRRRVDADGVGGHVEDDLGAEALADFDDAVDGVGGAVGRDLHVLGTDADRDPPARRSRRATGASPAPTPAR